MVYISRGANENTLRLLLTKRTLLWK